MTIDVKKEQLELLQFEKKLTGLAAALAAAGPMVAATARKTGDDSSLAAFQKVSDALVRLADATTEAHVTMEVVAQRAGLDFLRASGLPKGVPSSSETVRSLLGIG